MAGVDLITRKFVVCSFSEAPFRTSKDNSGGEYEKLRKVKRMHHTKLIYYTSYPYFCPVKSDIPGISIIYGVSNPYITQGFVDKENNII